jgi:hypothetical protein
LACKPLEHKRTDIVERSTGRLQPTDVDNEPVRKAHPYIHACINAGRNGAFAVAERVIEEDLIVTNVNPDRRQT